MNFTHKRYRRRDGLIVCLAAMIVGGGEPSVSVSGISNLRASKTDVLIVDRDGDGQADPGDILRYITVITNNGNIDEHNVLFRDRLDSNTTLIPGSIKTTPIARNDNYRATGNVLIEVPAPGVLANDNDPDGGDVKAVEMINDLSAKGGEVDLYSDGSFSYNPPAGYSGLDFFTYSIVDADDNNSSAIVFITVSDMIWFVDEAARCPCDGRLTSPFNDLAVTADSFDVQAEDKPGDVVYMHEGMYNGGLTLLNAQKLIGNGSSGGLASVSGIVFAPHSAPLPAFTDVDPVINSNSAGIILGVDNTIRGLTVGDTLGMGIVGNAVGTFTVRETSKNGEGGGIEITGGDLGVIFDGLWSSSDTDSGIQLNNVAGIFIVRDSSSNIKTVNAPAVVIDGAPGGVRVSATFNSAYSGDSTREGLVLRSLAAGSIFNIETLDVVSSSLNAVLLANNPGSILSLHDLIIDTDTTNQSGLVATNSGVLNIGSGFVITGAGRSVQLDNTQLSVVLTSVSSIGGSTPGIELLNTTGSFSVTGDGTNGSGGTISNKTGADGTNNGIGILLDNATNISLNHMQLNDFSNFSIRGKNVTNFELMTTVIDGVSGNSAAADEGCIFFENLYGVANFLDNAIQGGFENNLSIINNSGTLNPLSFTDGTFGLNHTTFGNDSVYVEANGTATINMAMANVLFLGARGDLIQTNALNDSSMDILVSDNVFENAHPNIVPGGGGITLTGGNVGGNINVTYDISGTTPGAQTFRDTHGNAITANFLSGVGTINGTIQNNSIGLSGKGGLGSLEGSGIMVGSGGSLTHSVLIANNEIHGVDGFAGIDVYAAGQSTLNSTITNNTADEFGGFAFAGMYQMVGPNNGEAAVICSDIRDNTFDANGVDLASAVFFDQISPTAHYNFPGYTGSPNGENIGGMASTDLESYLSGRFNTLFPGAFATVVDAFYTQNITGSGTDCPISTLAGIAPTGLMVAERDVNQVVTNEPSQSVDNEYRVQLDTVTSTYQTDTIEHAVEIVQDVSPELKQETTQDLLPMDQSAVASGEEINVEIGTLPPGTRVAIMFDVMVNKPLPLFLEVCNQGLVMSDIDKIVTDDPDTPVLLDPTCTRIDLAGDADEDRDVDWDDYTLFNVCMFGPDRIPDPGALMSPEECLSYFDFDFDDDVDMRDYNIFSLIFMGL